MALPVKTQLKSWGILALIFCTLLYVLGNVLVPFLLGGAIAYFLDPVADRLERMGASRTVATGIITIFAILTFVIAMILIVPSLIKQALQLVDIAPEMFRRLQSFLNERFPNILEEGSAVREALTAIGQTIKSKGGQLLNSVVTSLSSFINVMVLLVIAPVVSVYLLLDWDNMVNRIDDLLPRDYRDTVRGLASDIDKTLAGFVRGMGTVCLILGTYYAIALMTVGLQFGLVVGFIAGLVTFIPYLGSLIGGALAIGLALFQFWGDWVSIAMVAGIFVIGQVVEGNFLTPKLVGNSVGLHPVWLLMAMSVFGALFGLVGLIVAVPVAASLGVIIRFAVDQYTDSRLYKGHHDL